MGDFWCKFTKNISFCQINARKIVFFVFSNKRKGATPEMRCTHDD